MKFIKAIPYTLVFAGVSAILGGQTAFAGPSAETPGSTIYRLRCAACHGATGQGGTLAPALAGVVGRRAGATNFNYSPALKKSGLTWSKANLDRFLAAPGQVVPGTRMVISISDSQQRAQLINYLGTIR
jgi:cytochrome c